ncbi:Bacterial transcription activator, effector binding domain [Anatilimnocola aggregata]|uniref:Bacterial transcription activator, effector binding domain n=1 Tax=Anatilimnocola aggregata TaxID=2528021 RepID=A0A517YLP0_9BACT|nr:GyrI-like domain-containing protein [Anatilimnocola aggregata]QDU31147.1 Bacterial transcription activator, effector binding domain [Anatilimnocola aggregata]
MEYAIRLEQQTGHPLAVVRRRASRAQFPQVVPDACGTVWKVVRAQQIPGAGRHVAVYLDNVVNLEVGVEVEATFGGHGEVIRSATPAGLVASTTHYGPYGQLAQAHQALQEWCRKNGHAMLGPCWEIYGHWQDAWNTDPTQIVTEVCCLLKAS